MKKLLIPLLMAAAVGSACAATPAAAPAIPATAQQLTAMSARYAPVALTADVTHLSAGDRQAIAKLVEAAKLVDVLQLRQRWSGNEALWAALKKDKSKLGQARLNYFWINKGPWSVLDAHASFMPASYAGIAIPAHKPEAGNFYPQGATKASLETWMNGLPADDKQQAQWFFTTIRAGKDGKYQTVKYSDEYKVELKQLAKLLNEAAAATDNASLKKFFTLRAKAFLDNDYLPSDFAWMDLDSPVDITIGPYETYNDELFGYKAAFEAYVNIRDQAETQKLNFFAKHMQELEDNLPLDAQYRNPKVGALAPMVVVNQVYGAGDGNMAVQTAAYNLPNDERIISARGSKRV
ncbi:MAG: hypothetical protein RR376_20750, partial [Janthinobacterium sp.]